MLAKAFKADLSSLAARFSQIQLLMLPSKTQPVSCLSGAGNRVLIDRCPIGFDGEPPR